MGLCSVVIPTHNRKDRLLRTLKAIQHQTHADLEIIVSIDGSTDGTHEALKEIDDQRLKVVANPTPSGVSNARNAGIAKASGKWIAFCDDDDLWLPNKVETQIEAMKSEGKRWAICGAIVVTDDLDFITSGYGQSGDDYAYRLEFGNKTRGGCSGPMVERSLLDETGGFDPHLSMIADWDLWLRFAHSAIPASTSTLALLYVRHGGQMSLDMSRIEAELHHFRTKHREAREAYGRQRFELIDGFVTRQFWSNGQYRDALKFAGKSEGWAGPLASLASIPLVYKPIRRPEAEREEADRAIAEIRRILAD